MNITNVHLRARVLYIIDAAAWMVQYNMCAASRQSM